MKQFVQKSDYKSEKAYLNLKKYFKLKGRRTREEVPLSGKLRKF